jgi:hypothetical protein
MLLRALEVSVLANAFVLYLLLHEEVFGHVLAHKKAPN